mgnify:CR=1 FL=1|jgi:lysophospholipase L1-like esterase
MGKTLRDIAQTAAQHPERAFTVLAYGASESQFCNPAGARPTWVHWLEKSWRNHAPQVLMFNASIGGNCIRDLLGRYPRDVQPFSPDLVIITTADNDLDAGVSPDEFHAGLTELCTRILRYGGTPVLQTQYSMVLHRFSEEFQRAYPTYIEINRTVARELDIPCLDMNRLFLPYYEADPQHYADTLMTDEMHLNGVGNAVMGCLAVEAFGLPKPDLADLTDIVDRELAAIRACAR